MVHVNKSWLGSRDMLRVLSRFLLDAEEFQSPYRRDGPWRSREMSAQEIRMPPPTSETSEEAELLQGPE